MNTHEVIRLPQPPQCEEHEDYQEGCAVCFEEAVYGGVSWIWAQNMPGVSAVRMPSGPGHAVVELSFEGIRLFAVTYGKAGLGVPNTAEERIRELRSANEGNVEFWDGRVAAEQRAYEEDPSKENNEKLHRAMRSRGVAGARLDTVASWTVPTGDRQRPTREETREKYAVADALPVDSEQRRELLAEARADSNARSRLSVPPSRRAV